MDGRNLGFKGLLLAVFVFVLLLAFVICSTYFLCLSIVVIAIVIVVLAIIYGVCHTICEFFRMFKKTKSANKNESI